MTVLATHSRLPIDSLCGGNGLHQRIISYWSEHEGKGRGEPYLTHCNPHDKGVLILNWEGIRWHTTSHVFTSPRAGCSVLGYKDHPWDHQRVQRLQGPSVEKRDGKQVPLAGRSNTCTCNLAQVPGSEAWQVFWGQDKADWFFCFVTKWLPEAGHGVPIHPAWAEPVRASAWPC